MKYTAREIKENVNISPVSPIREFIFLLGGLILICCIVFVALGFAVDLIVPRISVDIEKKLGKIFIRRIEKKETVKENREIEKLFTGLVSHLPESGLEYSVRVVNSSQVNAFALPGGHIVVFKGLVDEIESENEFAFILGHELGHFAHRDHLRGLGRGLVLAVAATSLFGSDNTLSKLVTGSLSMAEMKFSREQESAADQFALKLINKHYGHAGGAGDFFKKIISKKEINKFRYFFSTHPDPEARFTALEKTIEVNNYTIGKTAALDLSYVSSRGDSGTVQDSQ